MTRWFWSAALVVLGSGLEQSHLGKVEIVVFNAASGKPVPCRVHLKDAAGKSQRAPDLPVWNDHFVCPGKVRLELPAGKYTYEIERGPEHATSHGAFELSKDGMEKIQVKLERLIDLSAEGWWPGELHVHRKVADIELLMQAEDLHIAPVITWWNNRTEWAKQNPPAAQVKKG